MGKGLIEKWVSDQATHLFVVGGTGAGKTTLTRKIVWYLCAHAHGNVAVLDFDGEYLTLPLEAVEQPFPINTISLSFLGWLLTQAARPEEGGFATAALLEYFEEDADFATATWPEILNQIAAKIRHDITLPANVRYALLWRINVFRKHFTVSARADENNSNRVFNLSRILSIRERQIVQQLLLSYIVVNSNYTWVVVEEARPGPWLSDIAMLARRRGKRLILVSQQIPEDLQNYEIVLFTPYPVDTRRLPLPVNPALDRGIWWIGRLGVHRLKHLW